jgi:hypothetical protein
MKKDAFKEYREKLARGEVKPPKKKNPTEKWKENKTSLRKSINAFCYECICGDISEIINCTAINCPLYKVRPYQKK